MNEQPYDLHGVNRHQDRTDMGWAITDREHDQDMALIAAQTSTDHIFIWTAVPLAIGDNQVGAQASSGATTAGDTVTWTRQ